MDNGVGLSLEGHSLPVCAVTFSPDGKLVASASRDNTVRLWDSATGAARHTLKGHKTWIFAVAFSPDGKLAASTSSDGLVRLWDSATGAARHTVGGHFNWVGAVFSPDGKQVASAPGVNTVKLWDSATGAVRRTLQCPSGQHIHDQVLAVAFSPESKLVASASADGTVRLWDSATRMSRYTAWLRGSTMRAARYTFKDHSDEVRAVAFSPDGMLVASASADGIVRLLDSATGATRRTLKGYLGCVFAVAFSPDGRLVASASCIDPNNLWDSCGNTVKLWDTETGAVRHTFDCHPHEAHAVALLQPGIKVLAHGVRTVAFSPDSTLVASPSGDGIVRLWDTATGAARHTLKGHLGRVFAVAFSPDGKLAASASHDNTVRLWDLGTCREYY